MPRRSFTRPRTARSIGRVVIIVCEGKETEYNYFEAIRQSMRLRTLQVKVVHPNATDPLSIVRTAIEHRREREDEKQWEENDSVWAVFDGDEHKQSNPNGWNDALQIAKSNDVNLAISNPSFEFWYLLHFQNQTADLSRQQALRTLNRHLPNYDKSDVLYPEPLQSLTRQAIERAKVIEERAKADELDEHINPCSGVCHLVESLLRLSSE